MKPNLKLKPGTSVAWYDSNSNRWWPATFERTYEVSGLGVVARIREPDDAPGRDGGGWIGWIGWEHLRVTEYTVNKLGNFPRKEEVEL